jgi:hypothetical protein
MKKYSKEVQEKIDLINQVFEKIHFEKILKNKLFTIDSSFDFQHYLKVDFHHKNAINISFHFSNDDLRVDVDRIEEAFYLSNHMIFEKEDYLKEWVTIIFTSTIEVEYCGERYTKLFFLKNGNCIKTLKSSRLIYLKMGCVKKTYNPIVVV